MPVDFPFIELKNPSNLMKVRHYYWDEKEAVFVPMPQHSGDTDVSSITGVFWSMNYQRQWHILFCVPFAKALPPRGLTNEEVLVIAEEMLDIKDGCLTKLLHEAVSIIESEFLSE